MTVDLKEFYFNAEGRIAQVVIQKIVDQHAAQGYIQKQIQRIAGHVLVKLTIDSNEVIACLYVLQLDEDIRKPNRFFVHYVFDNKPSVSADRITLNGWVELGEIYFPHKENITIRGGINESE